MEKENVILPSSLKLEELNELLKLLKLYKELT